MNLDIHPIEPDIQIVKVLDSRIDGSVIGDFQQQIDPFIEEGTKKFILDLEDVSFIDSTGLGAIIAFRKRIPEDGELVVCHVSQQVENLFKLTRLNKVLLMSSDIDAAKEKLNEL